MRPTLALTLALLWGCGSLSPNQPPASAEWQPVLDGLGSITGTVHDSDGTALGGARLTTLPHGYEALADGDGAFVIDLLPPGDHSVVVAAEGFLPHTSETVTVEADSDAVLTVVVDEAAVGGGIVAVTVAGPDGDALQGAVVEVGEWSGITDSAGEVLLDGVSGEDLAVSVIDADGLTWGRTLDGVSVTEAGGLQWHTAVSGRNDGAEFIGSDTCALCHEDLADAWRDTAHATALTLELGDALWARFEAGETVELGDATAVLEALDGEARVTLSDASGAAQTWQIAGLVGSDARSAVPYVDDGDHAWPLPFAWVAEDPDRPGYPDAEARFVGWETERWFGDDGTFVELEPSHSAEAACLPCHSTGTELMLQDDGGVQMAATSGSGRWMEAGVGCERCHGAGSDHRSDAVSDPRASIVQPELLDPARAIDVCGQCHRQTEAHGSGLPYPFDGESHFEPGAVLEDYAGSSAQHWASGAAAIGRMQADELALSAHGADGAGLRCFDCHDPHGEAGEEKMLRLGADDNALCTSCHLELDFDGDEDLAEEHVQHGLYDPTAQTEAGRCIGCHMPPTAAGIGWSSLSGAGDLSSHLFEALSPQETLDVFDDLGETVLEVGEAPPHACSDCHGWNGWYFESLGVGFSGAYGDPTLRESHEAHLDAFDEKYP